MNGDIADIVESPEAELLATGFTKTEGPVWHPDGYLMFTDFPNNRIYRLLPEGSTEVIREHSGGTDGMTLDLQGRLVMCEYRNRCVTRMERDGSITTIASESDGRRLNKPNDVVGRSDGTLYFTDCSPVPEEHGVDVDHGIVYRITPDGDVRTAIPRMTYPNGIALSPDESILYVSDSSYDMYILACDVLPDGSVAHERVFANMSSDEAGKPDGMKVDVEGRVYCTGPGGTWIFGPSGTYLGRIRTPEIPLNVGWGGPDNRSLFFTTRDWRGEGASVYSMRMKTQGTRMPMA